MLTRCIHMITLWVVLLGLLTLPISTLAASENTAWSHGWKRGIVEHMWVDFASKSYSTWLTQAQWEFVAHNYAVVSIEKCFDVRKGYTWPTTIQAAKVLKALNPRIKIVSYYNTVISYAQCYHWGPQFLETYDWWLKSDKGVPYRNNPANNDTVYQNLINASFAAWFLDNVVKMTTNEEDQRLIDGTFADQVKRKDYPFGGMSAQRNAAFIVAQMKHVNDTRMKLRETFAPNPKYIANCLTPGVGPGKSTGVEVLPYTDAACYEHFISHENLYSSGAGANGSLIPARYQTSIEAIETFTKAGKNVFVKGWPGPVQSAAKGWTSQSGLTTPTTWAGKQQALKDWLLPSLAAYLIIATETTFWSYNWGWEGDKGVYPCCKNECAGPCGWYPELNRSTGAPLESYRRLPDSWVYERRFELATVRFNAANTSDSFVVWHNRTATATAHMSPSNTDRVTPSQSVSRSSSWSRSISVSDTESGSKPTNSKSHTRSPTEVTPSGSVSQGTGTTTYLPGPTTVTQTHTQSASIGKSTTTISNERSTSVTAQGNPSATPTAVASTTPSLIEQHSKHTPTASSRNSMCSPTGTRSIDTQREETSATESLSASNTKRSPPSRSLKATLSLSSSAGHTVTLERKSMTIQLDQQAEGHAASRLGASRAAQEAHTIAFTVLLSAMLVLAAVVIIVGLIMRRRQHSGDKATRMAGDPEYSEHMLQEVATSGELLLSNEEERQITIEGGSKEAEEGFNVGRRPLGEGTPHNRVSEERSSVRSSTADTIDSDSSSHCKTASSSSIELVGNDSADSIDLDVTDSDDAPSQGGPAKSLSRSLSISHPTPSQSEHDQELNEGRDCGSCDTLDVQDCPSKNKEGPKGGGPIKASTSISLDSFELPPPLMSLPTEGPLKVSNGDSSDEERACIARQRAQQEQQQQDQRPTSSMHSSSSSSILQGPSGVNDRKGDIAPLPTPEGAASDDQDL